MKVKTILTLALAATTLAACHRGKKPPRMDNSKLAISLSKPAKGDRAIYGLACLGCSDTALVLLPNGGGDLPVSADSSASLSNKSLAAA